jgi:phage repressor protein C with HTH and peptisase S24 domain
VDTIAERLRWARERAGFKGGTQAATAFGWKVSTYLGHENGDRNPSRDKAKRYAERFKVRWEWLLEGEGQPTARGTPAPVVAGYVGAGAEIIPVDGDPGPGHRIDLPPPNAVPVIVRGDSMYPRYFDGETLLYLPEHRPPDELIGRECVVKLADGRMLVKILKRGTKRRRYNLESWNAAPLENQAVEWAAAVRWRT